MKTQIIEQALKEIQEDDQILLREKKQIYAEKTGKLLKKEKELLSIKVKEEKYRLLEKIDNNFLKYLHSILPLFELPASLIFFIIFPGMEFSKALVAFFIEVLLIIDTTFVYSTYYKKIGQKCNVLNNILESIKEISKPKSSHRKGLNKVIAERCVLTDEIDEIKALLTKVLSEIDDLEEKESFIEGNIIAINMMKDKYNCLEVPDESEICKIVHEQEKNKTLTRHN